MKAGASRRLRAAAPWVMLFPMTALLGLFVIAPIFIMLAYSFFTNVGPAHDVPILTGENWREAFSDSYFIHGLWKTIRISVIAATISALMGYPVAYYISNSRIKHKWVLILALMAPFWISYIIRTFSWVAILGDKGAINFVLESLGLTNEPLEMLYTEAAVIIGIIHFILPYMILNIYVVLEGLDKTLAPAARSLGCNRWQAFWETTFPLSMPGLCVGLFLGFVLSAGSYVTPSILGAADDYMFGNLIYDAIMVELDWPLGATLSAILLIMFAIVTAVFSRYIGMSSLYKGFSR